MKINRYQYKCDQCGKSYIEQRREDEPHYITTCDVCDGSFVEESMTFVEDYVTPTPNPAPIDSNSAE